MATARLTLLLACLGLAISRVGLVVHEVFGHGGAAVALGGRVLEVTFFWFAGGWIRYSTPTAPRLGESGALIIQLGGILAELLLGALACGYVAARRRQLAPRERAARAEPAQEAAEAAPAGQAAPLAPPLAPSAPSYPLLALELGGLLFLAHGLWYAATGTWHGFGDGARLHELLGSARYPFSLLLGAALCALCALAARRLARAFAPSFGLTSHGRALSLVLLSAVLAGGLHAVLTFGEVRLRQDHTYRLTMRTADERTRDRELARWRQAEAERGHPVAAAEELAKARQLTPPPPFPFARVLALAALLSVALGTASLRRAELAPSSTAPSAGRGFSTITLPMLAGTAVLAFAAVTAVALLDAW